MNSWTLLVESRHLDKAAYSAMIASLSYRLDADVAIEQADVREACRKGLGDGVLAWMSAREYLAARRESPVTVIASVAVEGDASYRALMITSPDRAGLAWPSGLKGTRVAFGHRSFLPNWILPMLALYEGGLDPSTDIAFEDGVLGEAVAERLKTRRADYIATYNRAINLLTWEGRLRPSDFAVAWASEPIPYDPIVVAATLPPEARLRLQSALISDPGGEAPALPGRYSGFSYGADQDYDRLDAMMRRWELFQARAPASTKTARLA